MQIILDFDDFTDRKLNQFYKLVKLKEIIPKLKVSLFCIPAGCSDSVLEEISQFKWVEMHQHGWAHSLYEWKTLDYKTAVELLKKGQNRHYGKGFKAPNWLLSGEAFKACADLGYWVAVHPKQVQFAQEFNVKTYLYNSSITSPWNKPLVKATGHVDKCNQNDSIDDSWANLIHIPKDAEFKFISEVI